MQSVLEQMKLRSPPPRCVVLARDAQQQWVAKAAGADSVLLAGFPVAKFFAVIEELLANGEPELD